MTVARQRIWPFLLGRGVTSGNRLLLVPDYLAGDGVGLLDQVAAPPAGSEHSTSVVTVGEATVVSEARFVDHADLVGARPLSSAGDVTVDGPLRDEHGRPIRVLYGFVVPDGTVERLERDDLDRSWDRAVAAYRIFHADERGFELQQSRPLPSQSTIGERLPSSVSGTTAATSDRSRDGDVTHHPDRGARAGYLVSAAAAAVVLVVLAARLIGGPGVVLAVDERDAECVLAAVGDSCGYVVTATSDTPLEVEAGIDPVDVAPEWVVEPGPSCSAVSRSQPCEITVRVGSAEAVTAPVAGVALAVWAEDTELRDHLELRLDDPGR